MNQWFQRGNGARTPTRNSLHSLLDMLWKGVVVGHEPIDKSALVRKPDRK